MIGGDGVPPEALNPSVCAFCLCESKQAIPSIPCPGFVLDAPVANTTSISTSTSTIAPDGNNSSHTGIFINFSGFILKSFF